jgi:hypothetical protein
MKNIESLSFYDVYDVFVDLKLIKNKKPGPFVGLVRLIQDGKPIPSNLSNEGWIPNMTIGIGREFAAQKMFNKNNTLSSIGNLSQYKVNAFGIGGGGTTIINGDTAVLLAPTVCDTNLYSPIPINLSSLNYGGYNNIVKLIESVGTNGEQGSIEFLINENVEFDSCPSYYTIVKSVCNVEQGEPLANDIIKMDEACLFITDSNDQNPLPFAHVCFSPKFISKTDSTFNIEWYVIF